MQHVELNRRRQLVLLVALLFTLAIAVAVGAMFVETGHHCDGALCPVCAAILRLHALLAQVGALAVALLLLWRRKAPRPAAPPPLPVGVGPLLPARPPRRSAPRSS